MTRDDYPTKRTLSLRAAMARAIERALVDARFDVHGREGRFNAVYDAWPDYEDKIVVPAAVVLPTPMRYTASMTAPVLLRDTWVPEGEPGFGLYKTSDVEADFSVQLRTPTEGERDPYVAGMEDLWTADDTRRPDVFGRHLGSTMARYGVLLPMPEYYDMCAGFWLLDQTPLDDAERSIRSHRETVFTLRGVAAAVRLGPVQPMKPVVKMTVKSAFE